MKIVYFIVASLFFCIVSASAQNYFNRSVGIQIGYNLPVSTYASTDIDKGKSGFAMPDFCLGIQTELPVFKSLKFLLLTRYSVNGYNTKEFGDISEKIFEEATGGIVNYVVTSKKYKNKIVLGGFSYYLDLFGNKRIYFVPKVGVGIIRSSLPDIKAELYMNGSLSARTTFDKTNVTTWCAMAGFQIKTYLTTRSNIILDADFINSTLNYKKTKVTVYDPILESESYLENSFQIDYRVISFMVGYSYNF